MDWNPGKYARFKELRLRPAMDLLMQVPDLPEGPICDLGCGAGAIGGALQQRFPERHLMGVDSSPAMLAKAQATGAYSAVQQADIADWTDGPFALIFSNATLHWLPDHSDLLPRLVKCLRPGGTLAVQVPHQNDAPSHRTWGALCERLFPGHADSENGPGVLTPDAYFDILSPLGDVTIWETEYLQQLEPVAVGHPVRHFTESTFARPILAALSAAQQVRLIDAYEAEMTKLYPVRGDGSVLFPFRRLFFTLTNPAHSHA